MSDKCSEKNCKNILYITNITLRNFRNYQDSSFEFEQEGSLIVGKNGVGKTNLLEAISYFTYGKSIMNQHDIQIINHEKSNFFLKSVFCRNNLNLEHVNSSDFILHKNDTELKVYYDSSKKKVIHIDRVPLKKLSDLYQHLQIVYSGPDDLCNIFSIPAKRRNFIDMAISKIYPIYIDYQRRFKGALLQRNNLLKSDFSLREKESWDTIFCEEAKNVINYRLLFFEKYKYYFFNSYKMIVDKDEAVDIFLKLNFYEQDFVPKMMSLLNENQSKEKRYQTSLYGPHRDDFYITINQKNAIYYASQGQKRSIVLALKLALASMISDINNTLPILIFDDTLAELDIQRCRNLLYNLNGKHQLFIASPKIDRYMEIKLPILKL